MVCLVSEEPMSGRRLMTLALIVVFRCYQHSGCATVCLFLPSKGTNLQINERMRGHNIKHQTQGSAVLCCAHSAAFSVLLWCHSTHSIDLTHNTHIPREGESVHERNFGETAGEIPVFLFFLFFLLIEIFSFTYGVPKAFACNVAPT